MDRKDFKAALARRVSLKEGGLEQRHANFLLDIFDSANRNNCLLMVDIIETQLADYSGDSIEDLLCLERTESEY